MGRWVYPLDPECPVANATMEAFYDDPMTAYAGVSDDWQEDFEKRHRASCGRCQQYGVENVDVEY